MLRPCHDTVRTQKLSTIATSLVILFLMHQSRPSPGGIVGGTNGRGGQREELVAVCEAAGLLVEQDPGDRQRLLIFDPLEVSDVAGADPLGEIVGFREAQIRSFAWRHGGPPGFTTEEKARVDVRDWYLVERWTKELEIDEGQLRKAVAEVGDSVTAIKKWLALQLRAEDRSEVSNEPAGL